MFEAKAGQRTNLKASNVAKSAIKLSQSTRPGNCFKLLSTSKKGTEGTTLRAQIYAPATFDFKAVTKLGDCTLDSATNGTEEWWRKMRTLPSAFFL